MKAYFIGGSQDLTARHIRRAEDVFMFVKMGWAPNTPFSDDGTTMVQVSEEREVYRLRTLTRDVAVYMHEDLLK